MSEPSFNFIIGIGRSGTTLLMSMLNAHSTIQATPEVNFFVFFCNAWKKKETFTEKDFEAVQKYMQLFKRRKHASGFDWSMDLFRDHIRRSDQINFAVIYRCFYRSFIYAGAEKHITHNFDKNPINTLFLTDIIEQLPSAKFVFLVRDPRANYLSRKEKVNFRKPDIYADSHRWTLYNKAAMDLIEKHKDKFYVLKYEDLVSDAKFYLNELAKFFDFENEEDMLNFHLKIKENSLKKTMDDAENVHVKAKEKYEKLSRPVNSDRINAWKHKLSSEEIAISSDICRIAEHFGYKLDETEPQCNFFKYHWGRILAKAGIAKNRIIYKLPLLIKLGLSSLLRR